MLKLLTKSAKLGMFLTLKLQFVTPAREGNLLENVLVFVWSESPQTVADI